MLFNRTGQNVCCRPDNKTSQRKEKSQEVLKSPLGPIAQTAGIWKWTPAEKQV